MSIHSKVTPIYQTAVFKFEDLNELEAYFGEPGSRYMYTRYANPNTDELAAAITRLERGTDATIMGSGMAAIFAALLSCCQAGDHILCAEEIYGGSSTLLNTELSHLGLAVDYVPSESLYDLAGYVRPNTRVMLAETITNPLLRVLDIRRLADECHRHGVKLVVDNTFASPIIAQPLTLGADLVMHSVTKYISGHSDVTAGAVVSAEAGQAARVRQIGLRYGLTLSPFEGWLAMRGLKTLRLRVQAHSANALAVAHFLNAHPAVEQVYYPGLAIHPQHQLAREQGSGLFGGMVTFRMADDAEAVNRFMQRTHRFPFAPSLAGVDSSLSHPATTSHRGLTAAQRQDMGITVGLIRLSVGIEPIEELLDDLQHALGEV